MTDDERPSAAPRRAEPGADAPPPGVSVVVPVLDERDGLDALWRALAPVLDRLAPAEAVIVDDGSRDDSWPLLLALAARDDRLRLVRLAGHHGQQLALAAGLDAARGRRVALLDADLQTDPREIPALLAELERGHDYVSGRRRARRDPWPRRLGSRAVNLLVARLTGLRFRDHFSPAKAFDGELLEAMAAYAEERRCLPVLAAALARRPVEIEVSHAPRAGRSRYSVVALAGLAARCFTVARRLRRRPRPAGRAAPPYEVAERR